MKEKIVPYLLVFAVVTLSLSGCLAAAAGAGAEAGYVVAQDDRSAGETLNDQAIVTKVKSQLLADSDVPGMDINVDSFKGVVTLKGVIDNQQTADKAITIARGVSGVKGVQSKLFVE